MRYDVRCTKFEVWCISSEVCCMLSVVRCVGYEVWSRRYYGVEFMVEYVCVWRDVYGVLFYGDSGVRRTLYNVWRMVYAVCCTVYVV